MDNRSFPSTPCEALAMLYMEQLDLRSKSPEEIVRLYRETFEKMHLENARIIDEAQKASRNPQSAD